MSLWLESLSSTLLGIDQYYGVNPNAPLPIQRQQAKCILAHLCMDVPRNWWDTALNTGSVDESHARIIRGLLKDLQNLPELAGRVNETLLVAMAFIDDLRDQPTAKYRDYSSPYSLKKYLEMGQKFIHDHPELYKLGDMIKNSTKVT